MNNMTWLDLYNYLHKQAHDFKNLGKFNWNDPVIVHDAETGDEYNCDTYFISDNDQERFVLATNIDKIFTK
jgi:hypothetical protein